MADRSELFQRVVRCEACRVEYDRALLSEWALRISADCGLDDGMRTVSFDGFRTYRGNEMALEMSRQFLSDAAGAGRWLVLAGDTGRGKTHLLASIGNGALAAGIPTVYAFVPDLLDWLRDGYDREKRGDGGDYSERMDLMKRVPLLLLDDVGTESVNPWVREKFDSLFDARYRRRLSTAMSTNLSLSEIGLRYPRVQSRIERFPAVVVQMECAAYHVWRKQQNNAPQWGG